MRDNFETDHSGDYDSDGGYVEDLRGDARCVIGEYRVAIVGVEPLWKPAGEGQEDGRCGPVEMVKQE